MGYASQSGRARTSSRNPQAHAICDRCGFRYNHVDLRWQYDWRGASMQNIKLLVCDDCYDTPQQQLRSIVVPADPSPIINARTQDFVTAETNTRYTSGSTLTPLSGTGNGSIATITLAVPSTFPAISVGSTIIVSGMQPTGFNKTAIVTACTTGDPYTISYNCSALGPLVTFGTVQINIDPVTGLPIINGGVRVTTSGILWVNASSETVGWTNDSGNQVVFTGVNASTSYQDRATQMTGEADFGKNQLSGTDPNAVSYRNIVSVIDNFGSIRLLMNTTSGFRTGQSVTVAEVEGVSNANGNWTITVVGNQYLDLQGSQYVGFYTGGGYVINNPSLPYGFNEVPRTGTLIPY